MTNTKKKKEFTQKPYSIEFAARAKALVDAKEASYKQIAERLEWNETALSSVRAGIRDIPFDKWELFQTIYKFENPVINIEGEVGEIIKDQARNIMWLNAAVRALTEKIAEVASKMGDVSVSTVITSIENDTKDILEGRLDPSKRK